MKNELNSTQIEYRAKLKQTKTPHEQQKQAVQQVVQDVSPPPPPPTYPPPLVIVKEVTHETKGKITNFLKPVSTERQTDRRIIRQTDGRTDRQTDIQTRAWKLPPRT